MSSADAGPGIAIVGGGISGLAAAWELWRAGAAFTLFEASARLGGVLASESRDGFLLELGPDSFLTQKPAAAELCRELDMAAALAPGLPQAERTRILHHGQLRTLPQGWMMLAPGEIWPALTSPLLSGGTRARMAWRWLRPAPPAHGEESVGGFLRRHFTQQLIDTIAAPLLAGVYGGDVEALSVREVLPGMLALEQQGNLLRALRAQAQAQVKGKKAGSHNAGTSMFTTLQGGLGSLPAALEEALPANALRRQAPVRALGRSGDVYRLRLGDGTEYKARAVILALPAWAAADLLEGCAPQSAAALAAVPYASALTVNYGFAAAPPLPAGFGFLVPRGEGYRMFACTFVHQKFAGRAPAGAALLRVFFGDAEAQACSEEEAIAVGKKELAAILGLRAEPTFARAARWPRAMAQYALGHRERIAEARAGLTAAPGLLLAGNAYGGIGIPDCIRSGREAARQALAPAGE